MLSPMTDKQLIYTLLDLTGVNSVVVVNPKKRIISTSLRKPKDRTRAEEIKKIFNSYGREYTITREGRITFKMLKKDGRQ